MADTEKKNGQYEKALAKALAQIHVYNEEWTNRLPSDPGITILENLTAFSLLLQQEVQEMPEQALSFLARLLGMERQEQSCAEVFLRPRRDGHKSQVVEGEKFYLGDTCFEARQDQVLPAGGIVGIYREKRGAKLVRLAQPGAKYSAPVRIFGDRPAVGDCVYFILDDLPLGTEYSLQFYVTAQDNYCRNPADGGEAVTFAEADWSYYTREGYIQTSCIDSTSVFLKSGRISVRLKKEAEPARGQIGELSGFMIKCALKSVMYDQIPEVKNIEGPLLSVYEKNTRILSLEKEPGQEIRLPSCLAENRYIFVYAGNNKDGYRQLIERHWEPGKVQDEERRMAKGEYIRQDTKEEAIFQLDVWADAEDIPQAVKVICMEEEMTVHRLLGVLYGYDRQEFPLTLPGEPLLGSMEMMAEREGGQGKRFWFFKPGDKKCGHIEFTYDFGNHAVCILDAGDFEGCRVYLSQYVHHGGEEGNVLPGNQFFRVKGQDKDWFHNPLPGMGGRKREKDEGFKARIAKERKRLDVLVTEEDYEHAVRHIPDLCIHKVRACTEQGGRKIVVYVKPFSETNRPKLSPLYRRKIEEYLEGKRLLCTGTEVRDPEYIEIDVQAEVEVKVQYPDSRQEIRQALEGVLDYANGNQEFGQPLIISQIVDMLEGLPCVERVRRLRLMPGWNPLLREEARGMGSRGDTIWIPNQALCCPGEIRLSVKGSNIL